jgi:hypothetical protein
MGRKKTPFAPLRPPLPPETEIERFIDNPQLKLEEHPNDAVACCRQYAGAAAGD